MTRSGGTGSLASTSLASDAGTAWDDKDSGSSAQLYIAMKESCQSLRRKRNIENVWRALEHLRAIRSADYSIAAVARAIQALNLSGPKGQSIRNSEGKDFRDLIRSYATEHAKASGRGPAQFDDDRIVGSITDLRTASLVRELLNESRSKDRRINMLKNLIGKLTPVDLGSNSAALSAPPQRVPPAGSIFEHDEVAAVVSFLKNIRDFGDDFNLRFESASGALLWKDGVVEVARPGFLSALTKIAGKEM